jgi:hypothetical protein
MAATWGGAIGGSSRPLRVSPERREQTVVEEGVDAVKPKVAVLSSLLALAFAVGPALADTHDEVVANIPFKFVAAGKAHQPGSYELRVSANRGTIELVPPEGPDEVILVMTRLATPGIPTTEGRLVFDEVGSTCTLSEIWMPQVDGFLVHATKEAHTHRVTPLARKAG